MARYGRSMSSPRNGSRTSPEKRWRSVTSPVTYALLEGVWLTPGQHPARFHYRAETNDFNTISSTMHPHDEYAIPQGISGVAVDLGAYLGSVAIGLALDNPDLSVIAVEPVPPNAELIRRNIEINGLQDQIALIQGAIGAPSDDEIRVWYGYRGNMTAEHHAFVGNSTLAYDNGGELEHEEIIYRRITLSDLLKSPLVELAGGYIDWLKIDTEGGEWAFLSDRDALDKVGTITGEWHPVRGHVIGDVLALLDETHTVTFSGPQTGPGGFVAVPK